MPVSKLMSIISHRSSDTISRSVKHVYGTQRKVKIPNFAKSILTGIGIGILLSFAFIAGFVTEYIVSSTSAADETQYPLLYEVQTLLDTFYLREQPSSTVREYAMVQGLISTLGDRHTFFIEPQVAQSEADALAGAYGGIGLQVQPDPSGSFVVLVYGNSPASRVGIVSGDILVAINGESLPGMLPIDSINQLLRGEIKSGHGVEITYKTKSNGTITTVFLPFEIIEVPSVVWSILQDRVTIGLIQISLFTNRTPDELESALADLTEHNVQHIILDLRNNGGGLLQEAVEVASYFLKNVPIVYEKTLTSERAIMSLPVSLSIDSHMVVLVNTNTASAAELVAVALQEHERAILVGQSTYGKGSVQQIFRLSDGSSLHVTTAEWLTPNHRQIEGTGVVPDVVVPTGNDDVKLAIEVLMDMELEQ